MLRAGGGPVKLSARQEPTLAENQASPAPAVVEVVARTPKESNAALQRMPRHPAAMPALARGGNSALQRLVQPKLTVSKPGDPFERQADAVSEAITEGSGPVPTISRLAAPTGTADEPPETPPDLEQLIASPGGGAPIPPDVRGKIEEHLGFPLGGVVVHSDRTAQAAAAQLGARAFTTGQHIFLGAGESAGDLALMAHEATHVVQQTSVGIYRDASDYLMGPIVGLVRSVPGYDMLTVVAGYDPIANRNVDRSPENLTRGVLGLVPFGNVVADKLIELGVVQAAYRMIDQGLTAHNLTLARIQGEIDQAWKEIDLTDPDGALVIVRRHVSGLYADALGFVKGIYDQIVQLIRDAAVGLAEKHLVGTPVWDLTKKVLHSDPLRGTPVEATTVEILEDFLTLIGKQDALAQMRERGTLQKTADWLDGRIAQFLGILGELKALFQAGWDAIQPENVAHLADNLGKLADQARGLIVKVGAFAKDVLAEVTKLIKEALLEWLSAEAAKLRGYRLMTVMLGEDPVTGKAVARNAENLIGGFIALLPGGEATYKKLAEAGVVADAAAQIEGAMSRLGISTEMIVGTFTGIWDALTLEDLVNPIGAFVRILEKFGEPLLRIVEFAGEVLKVVLTLVLRLMNFPPGILDSIITNAMAAIEDIKRDPVAFLLNMIEALKQGFLGFVDRAVGYLLDGLADWLFRGLGAIGIQKPPDLSFGSILTMVLQVLDITAEKLWKKLGDHIGPETVEKIRKGISMAEGAFDFVKDVQENGVAAIWKHVENQLGNLWDTLLGMVKDWIVGEIVEKATTKLLSMLDPTGIMAVVNSSIAFFKAVQSVIEYVREIMMIVNDYVTTLAAVAAGNVQAGAQKVEKGLASAVPVAIGFLANQVGLGNVPEELVKLIGELRALVDKAIEWLMRKAVDLGKSALNALGFGSSADQEKKADPNDVREIAGAKAATALAGLDDEAKMEAAIAGIRAELAPQGLSKLEFSPYNDDGVSYLVAAASPDKNVGKKKKPKIKTASCRLRVTLHFKKAEDADNFVGDTKFYDDNLPKGKGEQPGQGDVGEAKTALIGDPPSNWLPGRGKMGGGGRGLVMIKPTEKQQVKLASWNTGAPVPETNDSHAERQFLDWFENNKAPNLEKVELHLNISPCSICAATLATVVSGVTQVISWDNAFLSYDKETGEMYSNCTTVEDVALVNKVWSAGSQAAVTLTNAEKEQQRKGAFAKYEQMKA
jgi:tRNA(Arg) A34 adenosine deaminase TadA